MALSEETKQKFTTIAENQQKVYDNGVVDGKKSEYDAFWDALQGYGNRKNYTLMFAVTDAFGYNPFQLGAWTEETFRPKYPIIPTHGNNHVFFGLEIENFKEHCEKYGITIDLSQMSTVANWYRGLKTTYIQDMSVDKATSIGSCFYGCGLLKESPDILNGELLTEYGSAYYSCKRMTKIPRLWATSVTRYASAFFGCHALTDIDKVEGEIKVDISFSSSPITVESMKNIITHLKDYKGTDEEYTYKVTFSSACLTALEAEGATSPNGNTWTDYMLDLGWNYS